MKHLLLLFAATSALADHAAWKHLQKLPVTQGGLQRVELDPALLDASATALGDLRLVNPAAEERPFAILTPQRPPKHSEEAAGFTQRLEGTVSRFEFQAGGAKALNEVSFRVAGYDFIKAATLEGSLDGMNWQPLAENSLICRQHGFEKTTLRFANAAWRHFRLTLDDQRSKPIVIEGATLHGGQDEAPSVVQAVTILGREEQNRSTHLRIGLGAANLPLATLRLKSHEGVFQRQIRIGSSSTWFFRLQHEGRSVEDLEHMLDQSHPTRELGLIIENGDNPPLKIDGIEITRHVLPLVFQADVTGEWRLFAGNPQASAPSYDLAKMSDQLRSASSVLVKANSVEANPAFRADAALPTPDANGEVKLDLSGWSWRRAILPSEKEKRVFRLDLDDHALAHATSGGGDLRIIAGGNAAEGTLIPHLLIEGRETTRAAVELTPFPDEKRPKTSRWRFTLPMEKLPVKALHLRTSSSLFQRTIRVLEPVDGKMRSIGSANWKSTPDSPQPELRIDIGGRRQGTELVLETDNGDNPPLQLTSAEIEKPVMSLLFEAHGGARPLHLFYGQANAYAPDYDIRFVRDRFEKAAHVPVKLGDAEVLKPVKASASSTSGSPWLWAALVLVVGGLLWVVARLLPKVESAS